MSEQPKVQKPKQGTNRVSLEEFLEDYPPSRRAKILGLGAIAPRELAIRMSVSITESAASTIELYCPSDNCDGMRFLKCEESTLQTIPLLADFVDGYLSYSCKNCGKFTKTFSLRVFPSNKSNIGEIVKIGEMPTFGPPVSARIKKIIGPSLDFFEKGIRAESQGMGIAAFAYYRRVVQDQKDRLLDEIIKALGALGGYSELIEQLVDAKSSTEFSRAIRNIKDGIPDLLKVDNHNLLTVLYSSLSAGLHALSDDDCLERAADIRQVLTVLADRLDQALRNQGEVKGAIGRLLRKQGIEAKANAD